MSDASFCLSEKVVIECSGEVGEVIGRAEYLESDDQYFIRYQAKDGRAVGQWWSDGALGRADRALDKGGRS